MKINTLFSLAVLGAIATSSCNNQPSSSIPPLMTIKQYPITAKEEKTLDFFGTSVSDPYMWLENDTAANT